MRFYKNSYTMQHLMDAGVHYGHKKNIWNPKMAEYIYGVKNGVHIIDLQQTVVLLDKLLCVLENIAMRNGRILFVSTKKQAVDFIAQSAQRCGQYYVNHRWLGGMLTNWPTIFASIRKLKEYEDILVDKKSSLLTKKEKLSLSRKKDKLEKILGGVRNMGGLPDLLLVIDTNENAIAIKEANKLGIPVCAIADTNSNPTGISYLVPGNDDSRKSIELYCQLASDAVLMGIKEGLRKSGVDLGASEYDGYEPEGAKFEEAKPEEAQFEEAKPEESVH